MPVSPPRFTLGRGRSESADGVDAHAPEPTMADAVRILAIHAHPDDIEFQCAGTLALLARGGLPPDHGDDDARRLRQRRARRRGDRRRSAGARPGRRPT